MHRDGSLTQHSILSWINNTLNTNQTSIQDLGSGVIYCRLMNHYYNSNIHAISIPKNSEQRKQNLRKFQEALRKWHFAKVTFDINRVAEHSYTQNWILICKLHQSFAKQIKDQTSLRKTTLNSLRAHPNDTHLATFFGNYENQRNVSNYNSKIQQKICILDEIKKVVSSECQNDRLKVIRLKKMLGLQDQESYQEDKQLKDKDLLSDCKKKDEVIIVDE